MAPPAAGQASLMLTSKVPESCHARRTKTGPQFFSLMISSMAAWAPSRSFWETAREVTARVVLMEDGTVNALAVATQARKAAENFIVN